MADLEVVGSVVGGSLTKSLEVRLAPGKGAAIGHYLMTPLDDEARLLGMVTDLSLHSAESGSTAWPPLDEGGPAADLLREVLLDTAVYTVAEVSPYLEVSAGQGNGRARRLPRHFARVSRADQATLDAAFAVPDDAAALKIGSPLGMDAMVAHLDLERLLERSAGIFGKSGTGKSVLAVLILDAVVASAAAAPAGKSATVALVFDMHNDYGRQMKFEGGARKSLKGLHPSNVCLYSLDPAGESVDGAIRIGTRDIGPEDLEVLQGLKDFSEQSIALARQLEESLGRDWLENLLQAEPPLPVVAKLWKGADPPEDTSWATVATRVGYQPATLRALRARLRDLVRKDFIDQGPGQFTNTLDALVAQLQGGKSVVVQFGKYGSDLTSYMLVANMLSRRIWEAYQREVERALGDRTKEPNRLLIVIEEAHKFVDKALAGQSIFGQIARELRKYNVTLLVIDQRPSQIDSEVLSQIGTKFCLQLDSESDIDALVGGMAGRAGLRAVLATLESRQQALAFGHALPMPVVVRTPDFLATHKAGGSLRERLGAVDRATVDDLFG